MNNLEVAGGFKPLKAVPLDSKLKVRSILEPVSGELDLRHYKTLFIGYGIITETSTSKHYYVSGGSADAGWEFSEVQRERTLSSEVLEREIVVAGIGEQGQYSDGDIIPAGTSVREIIIKCLNKP